MVLLAVVVVLLAAPACTGFKAGEGMKAGEEAYLRGDYATAFKEFRPLAEQGDADAQFVLGTMYLRGRGVPQDYNEAVRWYRLAAAQGFTMAQYNLGVSYAKGRGVLEDYVQAYMWFSLAAAQGQELARTARGILAKKVTPAQLAEAQRLAREWKPKSS